MSRPIRAPDPLMHAAVFAGQAPSLHNSQPWRWVVDGDHLDLRLEPRRVLRTTDPDARLAVLSCGTALHHARVSLAAGGWRPVVHRFPDPADIDHLARLRSGGRMPIEPVWTRLAQAAGRRHTDRRSAPSRPLDHDKLRSIGVAIRREGADLKLLRPQQMFILAKASDWARGAEEDDPEWRVELAAWVGDEAAPDSGVHAPALAGRPLRRPGSALIGESHHHASVFAVLHGAGDERPNWLTAGEALSAGWLTATELAVSVLPLSLVVEVAGSRDMIQRMLGGYELPYLVLRFATADPTAGKWPRTPRLPSEATVQLIA
ncbi:Acg family FMN-binding oxidoreductase [Paractinoplanes durhamensis]|uniref:NAD(P)H nitroreductase n=1 Tax=Paractinoplanes durhamensis TaxID=113563 RepID=A0ABQ3YRL9_9ACTN|nr:nitroreductase [Actinoplanes durhamensis]GIE00229.1 NAD(P)H nitroreductase [Actinoplanes durhamensis]